MYNHQFAQPAPGENLLVPRRFSMKSRNPRSLSSIDAFTGTETFAGVSRQLRFEQLHRHELPVSVSSSPILHSLTNPSTSDDQPFLQTPTKVDPKKKSLYELQRLSIHGCESAAKIYQAHSKRPYFKKIDLLCNRLKQDLSNTNKAVININSHGVAWAIKDFIFAFNRIISAWVIMRDYFYSASTGMQCVKDSLDKDFAQDFLIWQEATSKLVRSLVTSFENLHKRDQQNGKRKTAKCNSPQVPRSDPFQSIFDPLIAENSEELQLSGEYLTSAVYKPLSSSGDSTPPDTPESVPDHSFETFKLLCNEIAPENAERSGGLKPLYKREASQGRSKVSLTEKFENLNVQKADEVQSSEDPMKMVFCFEVLQQFYGDVGANKILGLFNCIMSMPEALSFIDRIDDEKFSLVPNYLQGNDEHSITRIIGSIQEGKYATVCDVFIAVKMVAEYARAMLQFQQNNDEQMKIIVTKFVQGVESALGCFA
jgi:hypothetical protein